MKVCVDTVCNFFKLRADVSLSRLLIVDYILFLTADVTVTPNNNEIQDYKYVDKAELQAMFDDPCTYT